MQAGYITIDGMNVGLIEINLSAEVETLPNFEATPSIGNDGYDAPSGLRLGHQHGFYPQSEKEGLRLGHKHGFHPKGSSGQASGGDYGRTGGRSGANYLGSERSRKEGIESGPGKNLTTVQTKAGPITVNKSAAKDMAGAVDALVESGAPVGHIGSHAMRTMASGTISQHAYGGAMDLFNQTGRGVISREGLNWIKANPDKWRDIKKQHNLVGGEEFGDIGHVEWGGPGYGERHYGGGSRQYQGSHDGSITNKTTPGVPVRGSWFDDHSTATGLSAANTPGIALPSREGLGKMHEVTGPNGQTVLLPQIDVGPAKWTGRGIDISKGALDKFGYNTKNFPTDANFKYNRTDSPAVKFVDKSPRVSEQFKGTPNWGWRNGVWSDLNKSPNVEDRRAEPGGFTTKQLSDMKKNDQWTNRAKPPRTKEETEKYISEGIKYNDQLIAPTSGLAKDAGANTLGDQIRVNQKRIEESGEDF